MSHRVGRPFELISSRKNRRIIALLARGKTTSEIAEMLDMPSRTVRYRIAKLKECPDQLASVN